jgi:gamma-glutamyltranspeptidase / glutathione hydrolase
METWNSRRSPILSASGIAASSQPLASACGAKILEAGGSAADAAVAMAACCNVLEPCSTGLGGDAFALYFDCRTGQVTCLLGNGATSENLSLEYLASKGIGIGPGQAPLDPVSGLCVNVPGAASLWEKLVQQHGRLSLSQVLTPAIDMAENGFPVGPVTAYQWAKGYLQGDEALRVFRTPPTGYPEGQAYPSTGDIVRNPDLAKVRTRSGYAVNTQ